MANHIGTSGWSYDEWVGRLYPTRQTPKLRYYSSIFSTVEIDSTFYAYPKPEMVQGWARNTPVGFRFSPKLPNIITHEKKLQDTEQDTIKFLDLIKPILDSNKLGIILVQLPPSFTIKYYAALESFFKILPSDYKYAVEFRDRSWQDTKTWELLTSHGISSVITESPLELDAKPTSDVIFIRYHGRGDKVWYDYRYSNQEMEKIAKGFQDLAQKANTVYAYFNNHYGANAVENALQLIELAGTISPRQQEQLAKIRVKTEDLDSFL